MTKLLDVAIYLNQDSKEFALTVRDFARSTNFKQDPNCTDQYFDHRWPDRKFKILIPNLDANKAEYFEHAQDILFKAAGYSRVTVAGN